MPIWLRNTTFKFIKDSVEQRNEAEKKAYESSGDGKNTVNTNFDWANPDKNKLK